MISWESILSEKTPQERQEEEAEQACRMAAIQYAAGRMRSSGQVRKKLEEQGFASDLILKVLAGLAADSYLKDEEMAQGILRERRGRKAESVQAIRQRMMRFGIATSVVSEVLADAPSDRVLAQEFLLGNCPTQIDELRINQDNYERRQKILAVLVRKAGSRGFTAETALACLRDFTPEENYD